MTATTNILLATFAANLIQRKKITKKQCTCTYIGNAYSRKSWFHANIVHSYSLAATYLQPKGEHITTHSAKVIFLVLNLTFLHSCFISRCCTSCRCSTICSCIQGTDVGDNQVDGTSSSDMLSSRAKRSQPTWSLSRYWQEFPGIVVD